MFNSATTSDEEDIQENDSESSDESTDHSREHTSQRILLKSPENQLSTTEQIIRILKQQLKTLQANNHIIEL